MKAGPWAKTKTSVVMVKGSSDGGYDKGEAGPQVETKT